MTWPSPSAAGTRGYMIDRIDDELKRSGTINTRIAACIADAIGVYQSHRFHFSEARDVCTFNTVALQEFYSSSDNAAIATLHLFDYVTVTIGGTRFEVMREQPKEIELLTQNGTQRGQPQLFGYYQEKIRFYPVPDAVYAILVAGHMNIAAPASDTEAGNRWMVDAERLIRSRAKYELSINYNVNFPDLANRMNLDTGATAEAYDQLKRRTNKLTGTGRITPTQF